VSLAPSAVLHYRKKIFVSGTELKERGRVYRLAKPRRSDMWISICALTLATAISCCVAATLMQPKDDRATLGR
jgi:hypothetical protein